MNRKSCKRGLKIVLFFVFIFTFVLSACSFTFDAENEKYENDSLQNTDENDKGAPEDAELLRIWNEFLSILPEGFFDKDDPLGDTDGISDVLSFLRENAFGADFGKRFFLFLGICILLCLADVLCADSAELSGVMGAAVRICLSIPILISSGEMISNAVEGIISGGEFFALLVPIATSVSAIASGASLSYASAAGMSLALSFVSGIAVKILMPLAALIFAASLVSTVDGGGAVDEVIKGIRGAFSFFMGLVTLLILAVVTFNTVIAASSDSLVLRGAKYAIANMLPVVGNVISGTLASISSGVKLLSSSIGALSVITLLSFIGAPLFSLLGIRLCLGACIALSSFSGSGFSKGFYLSLRSSLDCLISVVGACGVVYVFEVIMFFGALPGG
ncbi:MAG: hypothetical protein E7617_01990 [Ruminococcaceae bacterium]|nr:hypothetical protein [Oscillospiraceae bacterium]